MKYRNFEVDVSPEMQLYKILQRQSYGIGTALAEFVDNSVQSFTEKRTAIRAVEGSEPKLKVRIVISSSRKQIVVEDNAGGINRENFQKAIRMGHPSENGPKAQSLSVYGIGMKSAAIWFSNRWKIETSALGSGEVLTTTFDLERLLDSQRTKIEVETSPEDHNKHYTRITIDDCLRDLDGQESEFQDSVLPYLQETFYKFEDVTIEIEHDHLILMTKNAQLSEPLPLVYPIVNANGDIISNRNFTWKKRLDFIHEGRSVKGFIMIMNKGSYDGAGIRLLRNRRVIDGTRGGKRQNKPRVLLGTSNKYAPQRIYGEIHLNDFPVNFMKTGFDINMDSLYRAIKSQISVRPPDVNEDFVQQATHFRSNKTTFGRKTKAKGTTKAKAKTKPHPTTESQIPFSEDLNDALEKLDFKKLSRLYRSLCRVSLVDDPVLAYVGAWTLLESLATQLGKNEGTAFNGFYNTFFRDFVANTNEKKECKNVLRDIHTKGNMNKHSGVYEAMNAQQLASDLPAIEKFLIHCAGKVTSSSP